MKILSTGCHSLCGGQCVVEQNSERCYKSCANYTYVAGTPVSGDVLSCDCGNKTVWNQSTLTCEKCQTGSAFWNRACVTVLISGCSLLCDGSCLQVQDSALCFGGCNASYRVETQTSADSDAVACGCAAGFDWNSGTMNCTARINLKAPLEGTGALVYFIGKIVAHISIVSEAGAAVALAVAVICVMCRWESSVATCPSLPGRPQQPRPSSAAVQQSQDSGIQVEIPNSRAQLHHRRRSSSLSSPRRGGQICEHCRMGLAPPTWTN